MKQNFSDTERKLIAGMSFLMGIRMLGVSMIIPVFSIFATEISGSTKILAGVAVGIFGISQTLFQIPMGQLSDRWGRKKTTILGLVIYLAGTIMSGMASTAHQLIAARFIAGAGAISGVTMAWLTDGINIRRRNTALSVVGISIGISVISGFTLSPFIAAHLGIPYLFHLCALLTAAALAYTIKYLSNSGDSAIYGEASPITIRDLGEIFKDRDLIRLNYAGFAGNISLTGMFFIMPILIKEEMALSAMWKIYVPMAVIGTSCMYYFSKRADAQGTVRIATLGFLLEITGALTALVWANPYALPAAFILFYSGHCITAPVLPAAISRHPGTGNKGTVMSMFNTSQFLGSGLGGVISGVLLMFSPQWLFLSLILVLFTVLYALAGFRDYAS